MALNAKSIKINDTVSYTELLDIVWPIGSTYLTTSDVSPSQTLGGTWIEKKDGVIATCGTDTYGYAGRGHGELQGNVGIMTKHMPSHSHGVGTYSIANNSHRHQLPRATLHNAADQTYSTYPFAPTSETVHWVWEATQESSHTHTLSGNSGSAGGGRTLYPILIPSIVGCELLKGGEA